MTWPAREAGAGDRQPDPVESTVPEAVRLAGAWAWRVLAVALVAGLFVWLVQQLALIVVPLMVAVLLSALLVPVSNLLRRRGWPAWSAIATTVVAAVVVIAALGLLVTTQIVDALPALIHRSNESYRHVREFLAGPPLNLSTHQLTSYYRDGVHAFQANTTSLIAGAVSFGSSFGHFVTGFLLTVFATIILLIDGGAVWRFAVRLFPPRARRVVDGAGRAGWGTLTTFVTVQTFAAFVNGVGTGAIAEALRIPLAVPLAIVVFLGSFVPVVGAVVTGGIVALVALLYDGPVVAAFLLAGVLIVRLVEARVLRPLVVKKAVRVHPLAVVLSVAAGTLLAGVSGALFAVPIVATANAVAGFVARERWRRNPSPGDDDESLGAVRAAAPSSDPLTPLDSAPGAEPGPAPEGAPEHA